MQHRYPTVWNQCPAQRVEEVVDGVDFTRDRNVGRDGRPGDRPGRDNYRPGGRRPTDRGGQTKFGPKTTSRRRPDRAATPMMTLFS